MVGFCGLVFTRFAPAPIVASIGDSLTVADAASGPASPRIVAVVAVVMVPVLLGCQGLAYFLMTKYYPVPDTEINY
jgi:cytochrome bd-type quinol oxidase subunit 2